MSHHSKPSHEPACSPRTSLRTTSHRRSRRATRLDQLEFIAHRRGPPRARRAGRALWSATRTLAQALAPNVRVNGIGPGPTLASIHQTAEEFAEEKRTTLTQEGSSPEEIVRALLYLVEASAVTGQMIAADGGQHLMWQTPDLPL